MSRRFIAILLATVLPAAKAATLGSEVTPFIVVSAPQVALRHVNVIDGTGAMSRPDQTVIFTDGRVTAIGPATATPVPQGAEIHDYPGYSVLPGLVGMHDHLFYSASDALQRGSGPILEPGALVVEIAFTAPRLYLAAGVTTLRTTGSVEPYTEARKFAGFWAESGMTSFNAYTHLTRAELAAGVTEAHRRGLKVTGHLCSVTWPEAALLAEAIDGPRVTALIRLLVSHHVAVTSTLPVYEARVPGRPAPQKRMLDAMSTSSRESYLTARANLDPTDTGIATLLRNEMDFERAFVAAGGILLAGPDPTGIGGVLPGFGNQREIELLVEAGFSPLEAIHIATQNGLGSLVATKRLVRSNRESART